jgi:hypothetical protein
MHTSQRNDYEQYEYRTLTKRPDLAALVKSFTFTNDTPISETLERTHLAMKESLMSTKRMHQASAFAVTSMQELEDLVVESE